MKFSTFAAVATRLENPSFEDDIESVLAEYFEETLEKNQENGLDTQVENIAVAARLFEARVFPGWDNSSLSLEPSFVYRVVARGAGNNTSPKDVEQKVPLEGGIGLAAASYDLSEQQNLLAFTSETHTLTLVDVYTELRALANTPEENVKQREDILFGLLIKATPKETEYIVRIALSEHYLGVTAAHVETALATVFDVSRETISAALQVSNDYTQIIRTALSDGESGLVTLNIELGRPIKPMRAHTGTINETVTEWKQTAVEPKYDGARVQVHTDGIDSVHVFSRNMNDITARVPEVVSFIESNVDVPMILDGALVAFDSDGTAKGMQAVADRLTQNGSQQALERTTPVTFIAFDCLYLDDQSLVDLPLRERYENLWKQYPHERIATQSLFSSTDSVIEEEAAILGEGYAGLMLKDPTSPYTPGERSGSWVKIRPDSKTLDVVVTGGEFESTDPNSPMRSFLVGVKGPNGFKSVGKVSKGVSPQQREYLTEVIRPYVRSQSGKTVSIQPAVVIEVGYEQVTESMKYTSGYKLDVARFVGKRSDKTIQQADSVEFIESLAEKHRQESASSESSTTEQTDSDTEEGEQEETEDSSVSTVGLGGGELNIVDRSEQDENDNQQDRDDDDDDEGSERIYAG